jgi:NADPH-dependent 2,4-dienoyl-CoA reductase/sulfur reductase-like enzyme/ferredoxin
MAQFVVFGCLLGIAGGAVLILLMPDVAGALAGSTEHLYWYLSRSSGIAAYFLLWASVSIGLLITSRTATIWPGGPAAISVHQFASLLGLGFAGFHALILLGDAYIQYSVADVLVPFAGTQYEHTWVGIGQTAFYTGLVASLSWYVRNRIGYRTWRRLHYATFAMFSMALAHGVLTGSDTQHAAVTGLYMATGGLTVFLLFYRVLVMAGGTRTARAPVLAATGSGASPAEVTFLPEGKTAQAETGRLLLDVAAACGVKLPSGCRAGTCGVDPVFIVEGIENLTPIKGDEKATLARLGLSGNWRLACSAGVCGKVSVSRQEMAVNGAVSVPARLDFQPDTSVRDVVIIGNGVAGTTAAEELRRHLPDCSITVVSREPRHFYNRMAIAKLIEGGSTPAELTLSPASWYEERRIECLLGAEAVKIDRARRVVVTNRGRYLQYDRLLLAGGSDSAVPPVGGWGLPGCFTLRDMDDAMAIRDFVRHYAAREAVVLGGGLLGLEAAYSLKKAGLRTTVTDRNAWVMHRQADAECGQVLHEILRDLGIGVRVGSNITMVSGNGRLQAVAFDRGDPVPCDVLLASTGISPGVGLARDAGLEVRRGILTDDLMRTSDPLIFAAGDIAEHRGAVYGLWGASAEQAKVAAQNMAGAQRSYKGSVSAAQLKVFGVDFTSFGEVNGKDGDVIIRDSDLTARKYRKLVIRGGKVVGAILLGRPELAAPIVEAARSGTDVTALLGDLQHGRWQGPS